MRKALTAENKEYIIQHVGTMTAEQMATTMPGIGVKTIQKFMNSLPISQPTPEPVKEPVPVMPKAGDLMGTKIVEIHGENVKVASVMTEAASMQADEDKKKAPIHKTDKWKFITKIKQ